MAKQPTSNIFVVIVAWNSADCIARCLESVQASTVPVHTIVIDNDSHDTTEQVVRGFADVTYHNTHENLGYAGGCNVGLKLAQDLDASHTLILNPDAYIAADCIEKLLHAMQKDPKIGLASPKIYYADSDTIWFAGATLDLTTGSSPHIGQGEKDSALYAKDCGLPRANGCAMLVNMRALPSTGFMDDRYFLYFEETDWSLRFTQAGYTIRFVAASHCWHAASTSTGGFFTPLYQYYTTRNSLYLIRRFGSGSWPRFVVRHLRTSFGRLRNVIRNRPKNTFAVLRAIFLGYWDYSRQRMGRRTNI